MCSCDDKFDGDQCENKKEDRCDAEPDVGDVGDIDLVFACNQTKCQANCPIGYVFEDGSKDLEMICKGGPWEINRINKLIPKCKGEVYFQTQSNSNHNN